MIANVNFATNVKDRIRYIEGPGRDNVPDRATIVGSNGVGFQVKTDEDVKLATQMMEHNSAPTMQASPTKKCTVNTLHMSLNWHPSQTPNQQEMLEAMQEFLKAGGMENAMAVMHRHTDKRHPHGHFVADLIDPKTGLAYDRYQFIYKVKHKEIEWERERNQITPERQFRHDIAKSALELDFSRVRSLLRDGGVGITPRTVEGAISLGGHFGAKLATYREEFFKTVQREPVMVRAMGQERQDRIKQPEPRRAREQPKEQERVDWSERLGLKAKTPEQLRGLIDMTKQQSARFEQTINDPIDSKRHDQETLKHYAEQVRTGREGIVAAERELVRRGVYVEPERTREQEKERLRDERHARLPPIDPNDRWWMDPIEPKQTVKVPARWEASGPQHDEPTPTTERLSKARDDGPKPMGPEPAPKRIGIPSEPEHPRPAMTDDDLAIEHKTLAAVAFKDGDTITKDELNDLIKTGGRLGPDVDAAREKFLKSQGPQLKKSPDGPEQDRWWMEPVEAGSSRKPLMLPGNQDASKDKQLLRDGKREADSAEDVKRREFVERMERSHKQFSGLTPSMRLALGQEPEPPKPAREADLDAEERSKTSGTERFDPNPPTPKQIEHQPKTQLEKTEPPKPVKEIDLDAHQFRRVRDREPPPGFFKQFGDAVRDAWPQGRDRPEPEQKYPARPVPMGPDMRDDNYDEPQQRIQRIRSMSGEDSTQRGQTERGDLEDRTDQTAEGRRYLKQQKSRGRGASQFPNPSHPSLAGPR